MTLIEKLKSCPFCGGEAELREHLLFSYLHPYSPKTAEKKYYVQCKMCNTQCGCTEYTTKEEAITAWNTRAADENPEPTTEELIEFINDPDARQEQHEYAMYLLAKRMKDENPPLTLDELREMDGETIEAFDLRPVGVPLIIDTWDECASSADRFIRRYFDLGYYGKTWLAYRRRNECN